MDIWINNECQIGFVTNREELWRRGGGDFFFYRRPGTNIIYLINSYDVLFWLIRSADAAQHTSCSNL